MSKGWVGVQSQTLCCTKLSPISTKLHVLFFLFLQKYLGFSKLHIIGNCEIVSYINSAWKINSLNIIKYVFILIYMYNFVNWSFTFFQLILLTKIEIFITNHLQENKIENDKIEIISKKNNRLSCNHHHQC